MPPRDLQPFVLSAAFTLPPEEANEDQIEADFATFLQTQILYGREQPCYDEASPQYNTQFRLLIIWLKNKATNVSLDNAISIFLSNLIYRQLQTTQQNRFSYYKQLKQSFEKLLFHSQNLPSDTFQAFVSTLATRMVTCSAGIYTEVNVLLYQIMVKEDSIINFFARLRFDVLFSLATESWRKSLSSAAWEVHFIQHFFKEGGVALNIACGEAFAQVMDGYQAIAPEIFALMPSQTKIVASFNDKYTRDFLIDKLVDHCRKQFAEHESVDLAVEERYDNLSKGIYNIFPLNQVMQENTLLPWSSIKRTVYSLCKEYLVREKFIAPGEQVLEVADTVLLSLNLSEKCRAEKLSLEQCQLLSDLLYNNTEPRHRSNELFWATKALPYLAYIQRKTLPKKNQTVLSKFKSFFSQKKNLALCAPGMAQI